MRTLEQEAQRDAEKRLAAANDMLWHDEDTDGFEDVDRPEWDDISAPYCGCDTCVVREVIDAAWPALKRLALVVEQADTSDSNSDAERHGGSNPSEGTDQYKEEVIRLKAHIITHKLMTRAGFDPDWLNRELWNSI